MLYTLHNVPNKPYKISYFKVVGSFGKEPEPDGSDPNRPENRKFGILGTKNRTMVLIYGSVPVRYRYGSSVLLDTPRLNF